jgi:hypothetical protein
MLKINEQTIPYHKAIRVIGLVEIYNPEQTFS